MERTGILVQHGGGFVVGLPAHQRGAHLLVSFLEEFIRSLRHVIERCVSGGWQRTRAAVYNVQISRLAFGKGSMNYKVPNISNTVVQHRPYEDDTCIQIYKFTV